MTIRALLSATTAAVALFSAGAVCAQDGEPPARPVVTSDVRTGLSAGLHDAGEAAMGLRRTHSVAPPPGFFEEEALFAIPRNDEEMAALQARMRANPPRFGPLSLANTDMAVSNGTLFMGNFHGFNGYDVSGEGAPRLVLSVVCPGGQGDVSVHGNLLFMSVEQPRGRLDCGTTAAQGAVNAERFMGIRIFDISDLNAPRQVAAVQTCRGSHTHTLVPDPNDPRALYIYNSALQGVRRTEELSICSDGQPGDNPDTALYSIDVIHVPLDRPQDAAIVNRPRIFADRATGAVNGLWTGGRAGVASQDTSETNHCHDITVYPELNLAAGACSGNGILLDITDPRNPTRISELFDPDMAYWHSATFNNDGDKVLFSDEWGGGMAARCQASNPSTWGADLIATIENRTLRGQAFHKLPSVQGDNQNCVAHNGSLIPVPGRDLMVQAWYQGGVSVVDFSDPGRPVEIAYYDRGPIEQDRMVMGGVWSAYWFNGRIYSSEIARGLDVLELEPSQFLSAAEIAAARSVYQAENNPQTQTRITWADSPDVAQAYLDQLARGPQAEAAWLARAGAVVTGWRAGNADKAAAAAAAADLTRWSEKSLGPNGRRMLALAAIFERLAA